MADLHRIEREIEDIQKSITNIESEELRAKMSLVKANSEMSRAEKNLDNARSEFQKAERDVHEINDEQAQIAKEKLLLTTRLTTKNSEKSHANDEIRREEERSKGKK